jgi:hypothetical protein
MFASSQGKLANSSAYSKDIEQVLRLSIFQTVLDRARNTARMALLRAINCRASTPSSQCFQSLVLSHSFQPGGLSSCPLHRCGFTRGLPAVWRGKGNDRQDTCMQARFVWREGGIECIWYASVTLGSRLITDSSRRLLHYSDLQESSACRDAPGAACITVRGYVLLVRFFAAQRRTDKSLYTVSRDQEKSMTNAVAHVPIQQISFLL